MNKARQFPARWVPVHGLAVALTAATLCGCGAELMTTTAATANLAAAQANQAQAQQAKVVDKFKAAQDAGASRPVGD
jgi:hypothetical protein